MIRRGKQKAGEDKRSNIQRYLLPNISARGPSTASTPYASISVLDPLITIERHHGKYHIAARFNIETTILNYENRIRNGHEYFFQDICLQYLSPWADEELSTKPESDPSAALTVTRGTETTTSGNVSIAASHTPSANVSLGVTRSKKLTVEYALTTWSLSAHRVTDDTPWKEKLASKANAPPSGQGTSNVVAKRPIYQWYWAGTHEHTKILTPDLKHTVKRHVVTKRSIPVPLFPSRPEKGNTEGSTTTSSKQETKTGGIAVSDEGEQPSGAKNENKAGERENIETYTLESLLDFSFRVQTRVKRRFGRFHRIVLLSGNEVKGKLIKPTFEFFFRLRAKPSWDTVPEHDTPDINALLNQIKLDYDGDYDDLTDKDFFEMAGAHVDTQAEYSTETDMGHYTTEYSYGVM